jgi:protoporphyrinogen oxidase
MVSRGVFILGGGMTGLASGWATGFPIYEEADSPGGICSSYYIRPGEHKKDNVSPDDDEAYRFEIGGGHWIFGGDPAILFFIRRLSSVRSYTRRSAVFFPTQNLYVPYPIQNYLSCLNKDVAAKALTEIVTVKTSRPNTMADWIEQNFGSTLTQLFFGPFHELYTAGLWRTIAPQDAYKSPFNLSLVVKGALKSTTSVGYNTTFVYPVDGLNSLAQRMAEQCNIHYNKKAVQIDLPKKEVLFEDGSTRGYETLISTLPLNTMVEITGILLEEEPDPFTSVLVVNIGALRGPKCPSQHWLYIPKSSSGFHRVGFYSNVDISFLPRGSRAERDRVSIYVERAYPGGHRPGGQEMRDHEAEAVQELQSWGWVDEVEAIDSTWIDVAYTWSWPGSLWKAKALERLERHDIIQVGRYARWTFQGIADSIRDGLFVGSALK